MSLSSKNDELLAAIEAGLKPGTGGTAEKKRGLASSGSAACCSAARSADSSSGVGGECVIAAERSSRAPAVIRLSHIVIHCHPWAPGSKTAS